MNDILRIGHSLTGLTPTIEQYNKGHQEDNRKNIDHCRDCELSPRNIAVSTIRIENVIRQGCQGGVLVVKGLKKIELIEGKDSTDDQGWNEKRHQQRQCYKSKSLPCSCSINGRGIKNVHRNRFQAYAGCQHHERESIPHRREKINDEPQAGTGIQAVGKDGKERTRSEFSGCQVKPTPIRHENIEPHLGSDQLGDGPRENEQGLPEFSKPNAALP